MTKNLELKKYIVYRPVDFEGWECMAIFSDGRFSLMRVQDLKKGEMPRAQAINHFKEAIKETIESELSKEND